MPSWTRRSGNRSLSPHLDAKIQSREDSSGSDAGSGWLIGDDDDVPVRLLGNDLFPKAMVLIGKMKDPLGASINVFRMEFSGTMRFNF